MQAIHSSLLACDFAMANVNNWAIEYIQVSH